MSWLRIPLASWECSLYQGLVFINKRTIRYQPMRYQCRLVQHTCLKKEHGKMNLIKGKRYTTDSADDGSKSNNDHQKQSFESKYFGMVSKYFVMIACGLTAIGLTVLYPKDEKLKNLTSKDKEKIKNLKSEIGTATMYLHQGEPHSAKKHFDVAFKLIEGDLDRKKGDPVPTQDLVNLMDQLGNIAFMLECYPEAIKLYTATINGRALNGIPRSDRMVTELFQKVGQLHALNGDYKWAELSFMHCIQVTTAELSKAKETNEKLDPAAVKIAGSSFEGLGNVYMAMNHPENALHMYKHAIEFAEKVLGKDDSHVPVLLNDLAAVYEALKDFEAALDCIESAIVKAQTSNKVALPIIMCNRATIVMYSGDLKRARELYNDLYTVCNAKGHHEVLREIRSNLAILEKLEIDGAND